MKDSGKSLTQQLAKEYPGIDEGSRAEEASEQIRRLSQESAANDLRPKGNYCIKRR